MEKRGPKRLVKDAIRVGEYGDTHWRLVLSCSHELDSKRKPKVGEDKVCCKKCISSESLAVVTTPAELVYDLLDPEDPMAELKAKATIASHFDVSLDQIELRGSTATIFIDAQQLRNILK